MHTEASKEKAMLPYLTSTASEELNLLPNSASPSPRPIPPRDTNCYRLTAHNKDRESIFLSTSLLVIDHYWR